MKWKDIYQKRLETIIADLKYETYIGNILDIPTLVSVCALSKELRELLDEINANYTTDTFS